MDDGVGTFDVDDFHGGGVPLVFLSLTPPPIEQLRRYSVFVGNLFGIASCSGKFNQFLFELPVVLGPLCRHHGKLNLFVV